MQLFQCLYDLYTCRIHLKFFHIPNDRSKESCLLCLLQFLTEEFYRLQTSSEKRSADLRAQNAEQASRLETYEHLEQELDQVTIHVAESKNTLYFSHYSEGRRAPKDFRVRVCVCLNKLYMKNQQRTSAFSCSGSNSINLLQLRMKKRQREFCSPTATVPTSPLLPGGDSNKGAAQLTLIVEPWGNSRKADIGIHASCQKVFKPRQWMMELKKLPSSYRLPCRSQQHRGSLTSSQDHGPCPRTSLICYSQR